MMNCHYYSSSECFRTLAHREIVSLWRQSLAMAAVTGMAYLFALGGLTTKVDGLWRQLTYHGVAQGS